MAETYKVIFPGNWVNRLNAYPTPNFDFEKNKRSTGFWGDRLQQAVSFIPGWLAVTKTARITIPVGGGTRFEPVIPSPYTRGDDKPLADVTGLVAPAGALLYRAGVRVPSIGTQPSYASQGSNNPYNHLTSGLVGTTAGDQLVLATALPAAKNTGTISATAVNTSNTPADPATGVVPAGGNVLTVLTSGLAVPIGETAVTAVPGSANAAVLTADASFSLFSVNAAGIAAGGAFRSTVPGGLYLVAEIAYLVPDTVATLDELPLPGFPYAGYNG
jgi:hypothetical protein